MAKKNPDACDNIRDLDKKSFRVDDTTKDVFRAVTGDLNITPVGNPLNKSDYDACSVAYPNSTTEIYSFYEAGVSGTLVATLTVTYTDVTKCDISSYEWT